MGHQISFYLSPPDIIDLEAALRGQLRFEIVPERLKSPELFTLESLTVPAMGKSDLGVYLVRPEDLDAVELLHAPGVGLWCVDVQKSPVIEFSRCYFSPQLLREGRVYYVDGFFDEDENWIEKSEEFRKWAQKIYRLIRKTLTNSKERHAYVGKHALEWHNRTKGKLTPLS